VIELACYCRSVGDCGAYYLVSPCGGLGYDCGCLNVNNGDRLINC
jgi:hypothetical protein